MDENKKETSLNNNSAEESNSVVLSDVFFMTIRHWPWILLSIALCVGIAFVYLLRTPNVYTRSAEILIKDDSKGKSIGAEEFANLGLFQSNTNIQNEVTSLKANDLMEEVVRRLNLDINYYREGRFHKEIAYGFDLPVKVKIVDLPNEDAVSFDLKVDAKGKVLIKDLKESEEADSGKDYTGRLNDTIKTSVGPIVVTPTHAYHEGEEIDLAVSKMPLSVASASYGGRLGVSLTNDKGSVIKLTFADQSKQRADDVLSTLINVYNENWIRDKNQISVSTYNFINERLGVIEGELGNVDTDISSYKAQNLIPDVTAAASMYMNQSQQNEAAMLELNNQLSIARYVRSYLTTDTNRDQLLPANSGLSNSTVAAQIGEYNEKLLQRNALASKSSDRNPLVQQLDNQLSAQRQAIVKTIDNEIIALNTQMQALQSSEARTTAKLQSNPTQAKNLLSVERQQKVKEALYLFLLQKREENELSQAFTAYNTRVINRPGNSGVPPTPKRSMILAFAFLLGLAIPFGITYLKEMLNTKVRGRKDIENLAPPFLGEIPLYGGNRVKGSLGREKLAKAIVVKAGKRDIINEAFRVLRTNLEFMKINKDGADIVAITSFNPASGKSFLSMNLATAIALKNKRVLVIDADLRHGSTSAYVGSPEIGLSNILSGALPLDKVNEAIVADKTLPDLNVLPIGTMPPNPTELIESERFHQILENLRKDYDYIFVDCPPIEIVADAQIIDKEADRTIFVLRAGLLERSMLGRVDKLYNEKKFKNMATILNGTSASQGYSHSYRYGYGYGYGYGHEYGSSSRSSDKVGGG